MQDCFEGCGGVGHAEAACRRLKGLPRRAGWKGTDLGEGEHALGIGLRDADVAHELRQAGSDECDRQPTLCDPVQGRDEGGKLLFRHVLHLVNEQDEHRFSGARRFSCDLEQSGEIGVQVPAVRNAFFRVQIHGEGDVLVADLHRADETDERPPRLPGQVSRGGASAQLQEGGVQRSRERRREGSILRRFDQHGRETARLGVEEDPVQEDGLPDATEADHQEALGGESIQEPVERDLGVLDQRVAPHEFGWRRACSRCVRVRSSIHLCQSYPSLSR